MFPKIIFNDSFSYGFEDRLLATIIDDPDMLRKCASSAVVDRWGQIDPINNHTIIHLIALGAFEKTGCNRNGDAFRANVCQLMHDSFVKHGGLYKNHKSDGPKNGYVVRSAYNDDMGRVELAVACHHDKCADFLPMIEKGEPVAFSMGFKCAHDVCSICGNKAATRKDYCKCVKKNASAPYGMGRILPDGRKCFVFNPEGYFNDISHVPVGAEPIAFDLRKIAALGENEVIGGAELAEQYFLTSDSVDHAKVALVHKGAEIEKRIEMIGQGMKGSRERSITKVASDQLRAAPVKEMLRELVKVGAVLPLVDFYRLIFGSEFANHESIIRKTATFEHSAFSALAADPDRLAAVCGNTTYDPATLSYLRLGKQAEREIAEEYSIDPDLAASRSMKRAASASYVPSDKSSPSPQTNYLLDQHTAYKVAAILAISPTADDEVIFSALL